MKILIEWIREILHVGLTDTQIKMLLTVLIIFIQWIIKRIIISSVNKIQSSQTARYSWRKTISYGTNLLTIVCLAFLWSNQFSSFATFLGLLSAGLAIAFKDPIVNMAGWYYIVFRKPFKVGDRVEVDKHIGDVVDISLYEFRLIEIGNWVNGDQSTGRILHIPNMKVFSSVIANYNALVDYIWDEAEVNITFESDWKKAKEILQNILIENTTLIYEQAEQEIQSLSGEYFIQNTKLNPTVFTNVNEYGISFTLRYLTKPNNRRLAKEQIWEAVLDCLSKNENIQFAYPTQRFVQKASTLNQQGTGTTETLL
jgi:small-conductance mechanosensitive channel